MLTSHHSTQQEGMRTVRAMGLVTLATKVRGRQGAPFRTGAARIRAQDDTKWRIAEPAVGLGTPIMRYDACHMVRGTAHQLTHDGLTH